MSERSEELKKKLKGDMICTLIVMGIAVFISIVYFVRCFNTGDFEFLRQGLYGMMGVVCFFIIYRILNRIRTTGKPFEDVVIKGIKAVALILIIGGPLIFGVECFINMARDQLTEVHMDFTLPVIGANIGIISEIFEYGRKLQEDNDLIA